MENHIKNIELINNYLNKSLSKKENKDFENRLKTDANFNSLFEEHVDFLEGLKRQQLKGNIVKAKKTYIRNKWLRYLGFTSVILVLIVSAFVYINSKTSNIILENEVVTEIDDSKIFEDSVISNQNSIDKAVVEDVQSVKSKKKLLKEDIVKEETKKEIVEIPKKKFQSFVINTKKDTTVICTEGTKLIIKANSFVDQNNEIADNKVKLEVTEYYKLSDILLANLTTQSDGKQLETGGMLYIEAFKGNNFLKLKKGTTIDIIFSPKSRKKGMKLFSGQWKNEIMNWTLQDDTLTEDVEVIEITQEEEVEVPFSVIETPPVYPGCENLDKTSSKRCTTDAVRKFINRKFNTEMAQELGLVGRQRINSIFRINQNGDVVSIQSRANHPRLEEEANRVIGLLPRMKPGMQRGKLVTVPYSLPIIFQVEGNSISRVVNSQLKELKSDSLIVENVKKKLESQKSDIKASEVSSYILRSSGLGWVNCDRFSYKRNRIKYRIKIKESEGAVVNMVFKSINSVMPSWKNNEEYDFRLVPENEDVVLVAIKKHNGKLYFDVIETKTQESPNLEFNFKEITPSELKIQLKKLN